MKIKTADLTDAALTWAVCAALGQADSIDLTKTYQGADGRKFLSTKGGFTLDYTALEQAGPIIEAEQIGILQPVRGQKRRAKGRNCIGWIKIDDGHDIMGPVGPTPWIAAMRCFVTFKLGTEVEIPDVLLIDKEDLKDMSKKTAPTPPKTPSTDKLLSDLDRTPFDISVFRSELGADPDEGLVKNDVRAEDAATAVLAFMKENGCDADTAIGDLLGNIHHLCQRLGLDFEAELERGRNYYTFETGQQDDPGNKQQQRSRP